jgi:hypothetical protein
MGVELFLVGRSLTTWTNFCPITYLLVPTYPFFHTSLIQFLVFLSILKCQESKIWAFFKDLRSFRGPQKQERKNDHNSISFGAKIKVRSNLIREKLMEFLLFNEVLKSLIFFQLPIKKISFMMLILI